VGSQPDFEWTQLTLPPRHFSWRIRGNALSWLHEPQMHGAWDALVATSMVDLAGIKAFQPHLATTPILLYMHENQFAYPDSGRQPASAEPCMINLYSALVADRLLFNSAWNRDSFMCGIQRFLALLPDALPSGLVDAMQAKSQVLPVPIEDRLFASRRAPLERGQPHLLWNHRWEYDKAPDRLLNFLRRLRALEQPFRLSVVGEQFRRQPQAFAQIREEFDACVMHWGFMPDRADYDELLQSADVVLTTALHDFQGLSMLEAMASGCYALAPDRLAYPEYVPAEQRYRSDIARPAQEADNAARCLMRLLLRPPAQQACPDAWRLSQLQPRYRQVLSEMVKG